MAIERVNSVFDVPELKQEFDFFLKGMESNQAAIVGLYKTIEGYKGANFKTLTAETEKLTVAVTENAASLSKAEAAEKKYQEAMARSTMETVQFAKTNVNLQKTYQDMSGSVEKNIQLQIRYKKEMEALKQQQKDLSSAMVQGGADAEKLAQKQIEVVKAIEQNKAASAELGRTIRLQVKEQIANGGSLDEMRAKYDRLYQVLRGLSDSDRDSEIGANLGRDLEKLKNDINEIQKSAGDFSANVGRYKGSLAEPFKVLADELVKIRGQLANMDKGSAGFDELVKQEQMLTTLTDGLNKEFSSTTMEIRALQKASVTLGIEFGNNTEVFQRFKDEVGGAVDSMGDIQAQIKLAASDTRTLDGMIGAAEGLAGAYSIAEGSAALFGGASEELMKTMVKLQAVMSILQGLQAIRNALQQESAAMDFIQTVRLKALTVAQALYSTAVGTSTGWLKAMRVASLGLGIGAVIAGIYLAVKAFQEFNKAGNEAAKQQERMSEVSIKAGEAYLGEKLKMDQLTATVQKGSLSFSEKEKVLKDYNKEFGDTIGKAKDFDEAERKIIELGPAYIEMIAAQAEAHAAFDLALEETKAKLKAQQQGADVGFMDAISLGIKSAVGGVDAALAGAVDLQQKQVEESGKAADAYLKISDSAAKKADEIQKKYGFKSVDDAKTTNTQKNKDAEKSAEKRKEIAEREAKALYEVEMGAMKMRSDANKQVADNENAAFGLRLAGLQQYQTEQEAMINKERDFLLKTAGLTPSEILKIKQDAEVKLTDLTRQGIEQRTAMLAKQVSDEQAFLDQMAADMAGDPGARDAQKETVVKNTQKIFEKIDFSNSTEYTTELKGLTELLTNSEISIEEFNRRKEALTLKYNERELSNAMAMNEAMISNLKGLGFDTLELEKQLNEQKQKLYEEDANAKISASQKAQQKIQEGLQLAQDLQQNVLSGIGELISISFEKQSVAVTELNASQEKAYEAEVARVNASTMSEEDKANRLKILEAERMAQKEANERKQRKIDVERARFQKIQNIANIITGTAIAVVGALGAIPFTPTNIALAAVVGALGAAQLAKAIATPLPKFEKGTDSAPGGWAITDEKGAEMYVEPGGKSYLGSNTGPVMRYLKPGTKIIPADEVNTAIQAEMMANTARRLQNIGGYERQVASDKVLAEIKEAIVMQTDATLREMRRKGRGTRIVNEIDLGWAKYIQEKTFN